MSSTQKVQWPTQIVVSKSKYKPLRPRFARQGTSEVAVTARSKLNDQAGRGEYDLRLLVGHANTLDNLIDRLEARTKRKPEVEVEKWVPPAVARKSGSRERSSPALEHVAEESEDDDETEVFGGLEIEQAERVGTVIVAQETSAGAGSYFDLRQQKSSPALSIMSLLDTDSDSEGSEDESDSNAYESDNEGSDGSNES